MATISLLSTFTTLTPTFSASLSTRSGVASSFSVTTPKATAGSGFLHSSFTPSVTSLSFTTSSFAGLSLGVNFNNGVGQNKGGRFVVVSAGRAALCLTKRSRSRKSLARTHGFRRRMRTTSGRAILKRRRAKGRKILCTKTSPHSGPRATLSR